MSYNTVSVVDCNSIHYDQNVYFDQIAKETEYLSAINFNRRSKLSPSSDVGIVLAEIINGDK